MATPVSFVTASDRTIVLGPREAEVLGLFWKHGPATVRQLLGWLAADPPLAYTTVMTICVDLTAKGLLTRRPAAKSEVSPQSGQAYLYTPAISEVALTRVGFGRNERLILSSLAADQETASSSRDASLRSSIGCDRREVEQALAYLGALRGVDGQPANDTVLDTIAALLERAELHERQAAALQAKLQRAEMQLQAAEHRQKAAVQRARLAERRLERLQERLSQPPKPPRPTRPRLGVVVEHIDAAGVCRVCAASAPPAPRNRSDGLRVCTTSACRQEARRRDNLAKQLRYRERQRSESKSS